MNNKKAQKGFGLLDVLIAIVVLSISAVAFITLQHGGMKSIEDTTMRMHAVRAITNVVETFRTNRSLLDSMITGSTNNIRFFEPKVMPAGGKCNQSSNTGLSAAKDSWCNKEDAASYQEALINNYLVVDELSVLGRNALCVSKEGGSDSNNYRFTFIWKKVTKDTIKSSLNPLGFNQVTASDCQTYATMNKVGIDDDFEFFDIYIRM